MYTMQFVKLAALATFLNAHDTFARYSLIPYSDSSCKNPIDASYNDNPHKNGDTGYFDLGGGISSWSGAYWFMDTDFPGAQTPSGSSAYNVWWKNGQELDPSCRLALLTEYSQTTYGRLGVDPVQPPGNVIVNAGRDGCFYSNIPVGANIAGTFCCGGGDCKSLAVGNTALTRRGLDDVDAVEKPKAKTVIEPEALEAREALSPAARAVAAVHARDDKKCKSTVKDGPYPVAGYQTLVANTQTCTTGACSFIVNHGVSVSTSLTSTKDQTITNSAGVSVAATAGSELFGFETTVTGSYEFAIAIGESTGTGVENGTTVSVSNNLGQALGTTAFVTFTPTYNCYTADVDCGNGIAEGLEFCNPATDGSGDTLLGDYTVVYI
ncbi:hypothetical protein BU16DRAFT_535394 [Lophium mytilinum]|uniref:Uncharacterized protein n=1 Tax=Lophium mytilinum TaxID=390894 RepID=A0A6A6RBM9_9PEZI|nr:hypothetical protein BU16DRAFT_535394 [Lophium mytilinum]